MTAFFADEPQAWGIEEIEARIETLGASIERCRKISLAGKAAVGCGAAWLLLAVVGLLTFNPAAFFAALAAVIGGVVLLGSNKTTWEENEAALREAEALRAQAIERLELRIVEGGQTLC